MLGLLALSITLSMLNPMEIEIDLYFHVYKAPLPLFLFTSFLVGSFVALLFFFSAYIKNKQRDVHVHAEGNKCNGHLFWYLSLSEIKRDVNVNSWRVRRYVKLGMHIPFGRYSI